MTDEGCQRNAHLWRLLGPDEPAYGPPNDPATHICARCGLTMHDWTTIRRMTQATRTRAE